MTDRKKNLVRPDVMVKPHKYYPSRTELDSDIRINTSPEMLAKAMGQKISVISDCQKSRE